MISFLWYVCNGEVVNGGDCNCEGESQVVTYLRVDFSEKKKNEGDNVRLKLIFRNNDD